jgi:origin recognition complex subunit 3
VVQHNLSTPQTFFDLDFEPDVIVGPAALDFLIDFFCRNSASVEGVLLILQLAHLKHFDEPLTVFVQDELLGTSSAILATKKLSDPSAAAFLTSLFSWSFGPQELASHDGRWPVNDVTGFLASVAEARAGFLSHLFRLKLAFGMMRKVQRIMLDLGYHSAETDKTPLEMMSASLRGGLAREGKYLGTMTRSVDHSSSLSVPVCLIGYYLTLCAFRKLPREKLHTLLRELRSFLDKLPDHRDEIREVRQRVATTAGLLEQDHEDGTSDPPLIADDFGNWLMGYFQ